MPNDATSPTKFSPLGMVPGYKRVAQLIEAQIVQGRLRIGELLPIEGDLATQLEVNRSTVREGLRALENAGLVRRAGGKRLQVAAPDPEAVAWVNARAMGLGRVSFQDLWEVQLQLEPLSARLAAESGKPSHFRALEQNLAELEAQLDDDEAVIRSDIEFHRIVSAAAENPVLSLSLAPIGALLLSATEHLYASVPPARHRLLEAHRRIAQAIIAGDASTARTWMERHIHDFRRGYEAAGFDMLAPITLSARALGWEEER